MTRPRENPLFPASLATDGTQGAGANTQASIYGAERSPEEPATLILALTATDAARGLLSRLADLTDTPAWEVVEAADLLDAARLMLARVVKP